MPWKITVGVFAVVLMLLSARTAVRGLDWNDPTKLSYRNVAVSREDYISYNLIANDLVRHGQYALAEKYAARSIAIYPSYINYNTLGGARFGLKEYDAAAQAYRDALRYGGDSPAVYNNLALLYAIGNDPAHGKQFFSEAVAKLPQDAMLWFYLAVFANRYNYHAIAQEAIVQAQQYGYADPDASDKIMHNEPFTLTVDPGLR